MGPHPTWPQVLKCDALPASNPNNRCAIQLNTYQLFKLVILSVDRRAYSITSFTLIYSRLNKELLFILVLTSRDNVKHPNFSDVHVLFSSSGRRVCNWTPGHGDIELRSEHHVVSSSLPTWRYHQVTCLYLHQ